MKRLPSPSQDCSVGVPEFPEKSCQNNWNPQQAFRPCDVRTNIHKRFRARPVGSPSSRVRGTIGHEEISKHHAGDVQFCPQSTNVLVAPLGHPIGSLWS